MVRLILVCVSILALVACQVLGVVHHNAHMLHASTYVLVALVIIYIYWAMEVAYTGRASSLTKLAFQFRVMYKRGH